jgi:hypothetical protein
MTIREELQLIINTNPIKSISRIITAEKNKHILDEISKDSIQHNSVSELVYLYAYNITQPICECGNPLKFRSLSKGYNLLGCSAKCSAKQAVLKREITNTEKYGVRSLFMLPDVIEKRKLNTFIKFGVEYPLQSEDVHDSIKKTNNEKYGVDYFMSATKFNDVIFEKYGVNNIMKNESSKLKSQNTCLERYGVRNVSQSTQFQNAYKWYTYKLPSGREVKYQGYENRYIPILVRKYGEENICFEAIDIPRIKYIYNGKEHYYFPDFYIPKDNLIVEIKSTYTYETHKELNHLKFQSTVSAGFKLKVKIYK